MQQQMHHCKTSLQGVRQCARWQRLKIVRFVCVCCFASVDYLQVKNIISLGVCELKHYALNVHDALALHSDVTAMRVVNQCSR